MVPILSIITNYSVQNLAANGRNGNGSRAEMPVLENEAIHF
jgi:hypothetical protein